MHAIGEEHHEHATGRIDPQRRACESGVAERSNRQELAAIRREQGIDVPSQPACVSLFSWRRARRHPRHRQRRKNASAAIGAAAEEHPAERRQIRRRAEQPGMTGDASHASGRRIVNGAAKQFMPAQGHANGVQLSVGAIRRLRTTLQA